MTLPFPVNPHDMLKKSLAAANIHNLKPYNHTSKNCQKQTTVYRSDSFCFLMMKAQISDSNTEISGLFSSAFLFKVVPFDNKFKSCFFSVFLASSRNSLSIESQKPVSAFFQSSISLMLAMSKLN